MSPESPWGYAFRGSGHEAAELGQQKSVRPGRDAAAGRTPLSPWPGHAPPPGLPVLSEGSLLPGRRGAQGGVAFSRLLTTVSGIGRGELRGCLVRGTVTVCSPRQVSAGWMSAPQPPGRSVIAATRTNAVFHGRRALGDGADPLRGVKRRVKTRVCSRRCLFCPKGGPAGWTSVLGRPGWGPGWGPG